jgi:hypothetical protein
MRPDGPRPTIIGPDSGPEAPFPLRMGGKVVSGFGRGSKEVFPPLIFLSFRNPHLIPLLSVKSRKWVAGRMREADREINSSVSPQLTYQLKASPGSTVLNPASILAGQESNSQKTIQT